MVDNNPRYPHSFTILRPVKEDGKVVLDANGDPTYEPLPLAVVAMSDGWMMRDSDGRPLIEGYSITMPFGYRTATRNTSEMGDVVSYNSMLHCPPFLTPLFFDDIIEITDYDSTYRARVVKKVTFNMGSSLWIDDIQN